jgi:hypothetical protein
MMAESRPILVGASQDEIDAAGRLRNLELNGNARVICGLGALQDVVHVQHRIAPGPDLARRSRCAESKLERFEDQIGYPVAEHVLGELLSGGE